MQVIKASRCRKRFKMDLSALNDPYLWLYFSPVIILVFYVVITFFGE